MPLLLIFVAIPILEIALFIQLGGWLGLWPTLGLVILTAVIGTTLLRRQGSAALMRLQNSLNLGQDPVGPIADGAMILAAGLLLLTPGFFTDAVGFSLLIPGVRQMLIRWGGARLMARQTVVFSTAQTPGPKPTHGSSSTVDGDFTVLENEEPPRKGDSGWTKGQ